MTAAYALGPVSGGHFNPAVSVGLWAGGRFPAAHVRPYIVSQVIGGMAANGYAEHSPGNHTLLSGLITELVMTFMFLLVILGATHQRAPVGFAGIAIGLALTLIHLISIPITKTSVHPARSNGPALIVGGWTRQQLWLFWIAPLIGAALAGFTYRNVRQADYAAPPP